MERKKDVSVATSSENDRVGGVGGDGSGVQIADDNAFGVTIDLHEIEHFGARVHFHSTFMDLFLKSLVATDEELLAGLAARIEGA